MRTLTSRIPFNTYLNPYATRYLETYVAELVKMVLSANSENTTLYDSVMGDNLQSAFTPELAYVGAYIVLRLVYKLQHIRL